MKCKQSNVSGMFFHLDNGSYILTNGIYWISLTLCLIEQSKTELAFFGNQLLSVENEFSFSTIYSLSIKCSDPKFLELFVPIIKLLRVGAENFGI